MNYDKRTPIKITVEGGLTPDKKLELTMNQFADLRDWIDAFKTILIHQTFTEDTVKELFEEEEFASYPEHEVVCPNQTLPQFTWKDEF